MATIIAWNPFNQSAINLYDIYSGRIDINLWHNLEFSGQNYSDVLGILVGDGFQYLSLGGYSLTTDGQSFSGGTVTGILQSFDPAHDDTWGVYGFAISGISVSAHTLSSAMLTRSNSDDIRLLNAQFAAADTFSLSEFADRVTSRGGNDTVHGNGGNDTIYGENGLDLLYGDEGSDYIYGGNGNDTLSGGAGSDYLAGGAGNDIFVFNGQAGIDHITDFSSGRDHIHLDSSVMASLGSVGGISRDAFWSLSGAVAGHDSSDRIIYDKSTGALYFDADGAGGQAAQEFAILDGHPKLTYLDLIIF